MRPLRIGEGCQADLADPFAGQPILEQRLHRIAVGQALVGVAQVEMGVQRQQPRPRQTEAVDAGPGDGVVAADQHGQPAPRLCRHRIAHGHEGIGRGDRLQRQIAGVMHRDSQRLSGLDIIGREPRQHGPERLRPEVTSPRRQRPLVQSSADQGDGGVGVVSDEVGETGPAKGF